MESRIALRFIRATLALQIDGDRLPDIGQRLVAGVTLGNTAGQGGHFGNEHAVVVLLDQYWYFIYTARPIGACSRIVAKAVEASPARTAASLRRFAFQPIRQSHCPHCGEAPGEARLHPSALTRMAE
jgi:hypothetical protein